MLLILISVASSIFGVSVSQAGFGHPVGYGPGFIQPFPNMVPPIMIPQVPMPYVPIMPGNSAFGQAGGAVVSRSNFGPDGGTTTYVSSDPYGGYRVDTVSTQSHPSQGHSVIHSRFNDDDESASRSVHSKHVRGGNPSNFGTSSFISSTNVNGHQETVSSTNNNGFVQTYRQTNGK